MRTKTLLLTAALGAAGVASALAQVYSVNAVGYVNKTLKPGFNLVCNPLNTGGNTLQEVIPAASVPDGTLVYEFTAGSGYTGIFENDGGWGAAGSRTFAPGRGFWIKNIGTTDLTITFVGEVPQGPLTTPLIVGFNLIGSQVPQAGKITTDLKLVANDGDTVYQYTAGQGYTAIVEYDAGWGANEPTLQVGEAVFFKALAAGSWSRTFDVNNPN